jgi:hypothetical protein
LSDPLFVAGVDLGQAKDPTAEAVIELAAPALHLRHLQRLPLGMPYPEVATRIGATMKALPSPGELVVDATGVGRPVLDMLRDAGLDPVAVCITGGRAVTFDGDMWRVPKRILVQALVTAFEGGWLKVARGLSHAKALTRELHSFERRVNARGHDAYNGVGEHDDLVIATALATWWAGVVLESGSGRLRA